MSRPAGDIPNHYTGASKAKGQHILKNSHFPEIWKRLFFVMLGLPMKMAKHQPPVLSHLGRG